MTSIFAGEATIVAARALGRLVRRVSRSPFACDVHRAAPYLAAVAAGCILFPAVHLLCQVIAALG